MNIDPGVSFPIGADPRDGGVNFSVFSDRAERIELLLFDRVDDAQPAAALPLDPVNHRTYHYWHAFVPGLKPGQIYAYRAHGPFDPSRGLRFDSGKVLLDPYGRATAVPTAYDRAAAARPGDNAATAMKSAVADLSSYDWEGDRPLQHPFSRTVVYEMHVGGFTRHPNSGVAEGRRGTFAGLIDKIPYLHDLGITAVELLPVFQFDPYAAPVGKVNYWGYQPVSYFAPHHAYSSRPNPLGALDEFRDMVKALHRAGIEVILDVVYNHTAEGGDGGPTLCYRGLANDAYYILQRDRAHYADYTGCGNTLDGNQSVVRRMILDSLRYWVSEMHVDGFRFDLASILSRDEFGEPIKNPPVLWDIETDPALAGTKLIAEAWDAAGLYQVGSFVGESWTEWNGRFRDDIRRFVRGDNNTVRPLASRVLGSPDIYAHEDREAEQSINFVACHDGFTLNDVVSYNHKHNQDNGEDNRDGANDNFTWNCGAEGPSDDPEIERLRTRQVKNLLAVELVSVGTPMLLMGDEVRRTQRGNNNAYCQDNEISWFDWSNVERHADVLRFAQTVIRMRLRLDAAGGMAAGDLTLNELLIHAQAQFHGTKLGQPDWGETSHSLAITLRAAPAHLVLHLLMNAYWEPLDFELPAMIDVGRRWRRLIDTALPTPDDICAFRDAASVQAPAYRAQPRSVVLLAAELN